MRLAHVVIPAVAFLALSACGGGDPPEPSPEPDGAKSPTVVEQTGSEIDSVTSAATAEALRKTVVGNCEIGPGAQCEGADFGGADLDPGDAGWQNFDPVDLADANLRNADLSGVSMFQGSLEGADLTGANLRGAQLRSASLKDASLKDADLTDANLTFADVRGANFEGAIFCNTIMPKGETNNTDC